MTARKKTVKKAPKKKAPARKAPAKPAAAFPSTAAKTTQDTTVILKAIKERASGIVLELSESEGKLSFRHEKELQEIRPLSPKVARLVMNQLKRMAEMKRDPETGVDTGNIQLNLLGRAFEYRVRSESEGGRERLFAELVAGKGES